VVALRPGRRGRPAGGRAGWPGHWWPAAAYLAGLTNGINVIFVACAGFVPLLTPTGTLPSPHWRWWPSGRGGSGGGLRAGVGRRPEPLYPEYSDVDSPIGVPAMGEPARRRHPRLRPRRPDRARSRGLVPGRALPPGREIERLQLRWLALGRRPGRPGAGGGHRRARSGRGHGPVPGGAGRLPGPAAAGHRGGDPALPPLRPGPAHQPHGGLWAAHSAAGRRLRPASATRSTWTPCTASC
jgi:translation initiation factor IF-2